MRTATRDLLRLSFTAAAIATLAFSASFAGTHVHSPRDAATASDDAIVHVEAITHARADVFPSAAQANAIEAEAPRAVSVGKPRSAHRVLLALAQ